MLIDDLYFKIWFKLNYACCPKGLYEDGKAIDTADPEVMKRKHHDVVATISRGRLDRIPDYLDVLPRECFSERALECFRRAKLDLWEFEWVQVRVFGRTGAYVGKFYWPKRMPLKILDALDYEYAEYEFITPHGPNARPGERLIRNVEVWVLNRDAIGSADIFITHNCMWFVSKRFKEVVESNGLRGFEFRSVPTWVSP